MLWFSFNFIIYLQVAKTCEDYNSINKFKFLFYEKIILSVQNKKSLEFLDIISIFWMQKYGLVN